jgi:hypothetical protein
MTDFSPAAQAVLDAFLDTPGCEPLPGWDYKRDIAAALRAAADQAMPEFFTLGPVSSKIKGQKIRPGLIRYRLFAKMIRNRLFAIAAELDNTSPPSK